jgi:UDP-glucose 4-epimerase
MLSHFPLSASEFDGPVLVTGAGGCIGSWVLALLTHAGVPVSSFDLKADTRRPALLMSEADLKKVHWYEGDIADTAAVKAAVQTQQGSRHHPFGGLASAVLPCQPRGWCVGECGGHSECV